MIIWTIPNLEHQLDDTNGVVVAHWRATAGDGEYAASAYGTCGFQPDPDVEGWVEYQHITEEMVLGWCYAELDKDAIEASLAANIELQKNPTQASGVPW